MYTTTARSLIDSSFRLIGVLAAEETPTAQEAQDALEVLNGLIDSWGLQPLTMTSDARYTTPVISGQQSYLVGELGEIPIEPPVAFDHLAWVQTTNTPVNERPMQELTWDAYQAVLIKELTSTLPTYWHYDRTSAEIATIWLWPIPTDSTLELALYVATPTTQFDNLTVSVTLPWGYYKAFRYNLAIELAPEYGRVPRDDIYMHARESLSRVKASNVQMSDLSIDLGLHPSGHGNYNILTDSGG